MRVRLIVWPLLAAVLLEAQPRWELQYFLDEDETSLALADLQFPSNRRGVAAGVLTTKGRTQPVCLVTADGGATWSTVRLKAEPVSLFFLDDSLGWMVTGDGLWVTEESGLTWRKLGAPRDLLRVYFLDPQRGFGVGLQRKAWRTADGGRSWERIAETEEMSGDPRRVVLGWIEFLDQRRGLITGWNRPRGQEDDLPDWMDPQRPKRRVQPTLSVTLETNDGGLTWKPSSSSMFGRVTRTRFDRRGTLWLIEFPSHFDWPSEVFWTQWRSAEARRVYRTKEVRVTDVMWRQEHAYVAGVAQRGQLAETPVPSPVRVLRSKNLSLWEEIETDYRAVARRVYLAASPEEGLWLATDTGMILKLADR
jgi:hypothetical protein